jgi:hypothetical protein
MKACALMAAREDVELRVENDRLRHELTIAQTRVRQLEVACDIQRRLLVSGARGPSPSGNGPGRHLLKE